MYMLNTTENKGTGYVTLEDTILTSCTSSQGSRFRPVCVLVCGNATVLVKNSHSSFGTICMRNRVEVGKTIRNYLELI